MKPPLLALAALLVTAALTHAGTPAQVEIASTLDGFDLTPLYAQTKPDAHGTFTTLPKVTTKNDRRARIQIVREIPLVPPEQSTSDASPSTEPIGVIFEITPHFTGTQIAYTGKLILSIAPGYSPSHPTPVPIHSILTPLSGQAPNGRPVTIKTTAPSGEAVTFTFTLSAMDQDGQPATLAK